MTGDRWPRVSELFEAALQRDPRARAALLAEVAHIGDVLVTRDGASYVYNCQRTLSDLYLAEGLR